MKFKFETGEVIECNDEAIIKLLRQDKRYTEEKKTKVEDTTKGSKKKTKVEDTENVNPDLIKGDNDGEIQE